ncbi:MAG: OmpA family protein [Pseudomonadota bacterium]
MLAACLLLGGCSHGGQPVLPSIADAGQRSQLSVVWQEHAYDGNGFHFVPAATFVLANAPVVTKLTPLPPAEPVVVRRPATQVEAREITIHFSLNSAALSPKAKGTLSAHSNELSHAEDVTIAGYTCSLGTKDVNDRLAGARAASVATYLEAAGVSVTAVSGHGRCRYAAPNDTEDGRARNRRAEVRYVTQD